MFSLLNGIYDSYFSPVQLNVLVVGGHGSGKTAFLERLRVTDIPTRSSGSGSSGGSGGGRKSMTGRMSSEDVTKNLERALAETGAEYIRHKLDDENKKQRHRSSSFSSAAAAAAAAASAESTPTKASSGTEAVTQNKKRFSFCPAPQRYLKAAQDDQDEEVEEEAATAEKQAGGGGSGGWEQEIRNELNNDATSAISAPPQRVRCHSKELDMDSLDLMDGRKSSMQDIPLDQPVVVSTATSVSSGPSQPTQQIRRRKSNDGDRIDDDDDKETMQQEVPQQLSQLSSSRHHPRSINNDNNSNPPLRQMSSEEYDMKPKVTMLPLRLIRPTIGTNLKKIDMYGAQCHCFDVGGKLQALWERYYDDCDAVIFCWRLGDDPDDSRKTKSDNDDDDDVDDDVDVDDPSELYEKQQTILNQVRKSIPDEVPFLVFGHIMGNANVEVTDRMFSTDMLLPHYHNPMTSMCCGSAKTGAGIQSAMDWLIPLAKRQQKERQQDRRHLDEKHL
mmetsp:Transcript_35320/g.85481  ORF Transcript_35320/g.85481 Transcript_35320/m.85481 type:complete len:502 (-) Transcript_35320:54-1559(-)